jgi:hypothetical protein
LTLVGFALPRDHTVASRITLHQPPDSVFSVIRDIGAISSWWPTVKQVNRRNDPQGREIWDETMKDGMVMGLEVAAEDPPGMVKTVIVGDAPFGGSWTTRIVSVPGGSTVTVTEDGWVSNPIFRLLSRLMGHHSTMDSYLTALGSHFGEQVSPQHFGPAE